jgi:S1-C subfamily serine protease
MNKLKQTLFFLVIGMLGGFLSLHFFSLRYIEKYLVSGDRTDLLPIEVIERKEVTIRENEALVERMERVEKAVVGIETDFRGRKIQGSGLIVSSDGLLIAFAETVPLGGSFSFLINGDKIPYQVIKRDSKNGLVLIKLERTGLTTLEFANLERVKPGERVFLVGAVFNENNEIQKSFNQGTIKRVDKYIRTNIIEENRFLGSTLFDVEGRILGLNLISQKNEVYALTVSEIQEFIGL